MPVLVIGGAGFIGSHLVDELLVAGSEVMVIDDLSTGNLENLSRWKGNDKLDFARVDARDEFILKRSMDHKNWVFDFVGIDCLLLDIAAKTSDVKRVIKNATVHDEDCPITTLLYASVYGPRGPKNGHMFVSDIVRANVMTAMNREIKGNVNLLPDGNEELGWKPLVDQGQGKYIIEMYEKVNTSPIIIATR